MVDGTTAHTLTLTENPAVRAVAEVLNLAQALAARAQPAKATPAAAAQAVRAPAAAGARVVQAGAAAPTAVTAVRAFHLLLPARLLHAVAGAAAHRLVQAAQAEEVRAVLIRLAMARVPQAQLTRAAAAEVAAQPVWAPMAVQVLSR